VDLLRQVAVVAPDSTTARAASEAVAGLERGVVTGGSAALTGSATGPGTPS